MANIRFGDKTITLPRSRIARMAIGVGLILCGIVGFLPVLGFWMIPLGLLVLSVDLPPVRRWRRNAQVAIGKWWRRRRNGDS